MKKNTIAVLTAGGDCPGINAVIRAVVKGFLCQCGGEVIGIEDGFDGLLHNRCRKISFDNVSNILTLGGTILGTSKQANPYQYAVKTGGKLSFKDISRTALKNLKALNVRCLVSIGGDGTLAMAPRLYQDGVAVIGVPKTIDNDIKETDISFGFDSALTIATEGIDRVHTTAESHHRIMIVEVMGHHAGWLALHSGIAAGADVILIPEIPYTLSKIAQKIKERKQKGKRFSIVVIAEGAKPRGGNIVIQRIVKESSDPVRLGGVGFVLGKQLEKVTGLETRTVVMGHLQRGGSPTPFDRVFATQLGIKAIDMIEANNFGKMAALKNNAFVDVPLSLVATGPRLVPLDHALIKSARRIDTCLGD